jgi:hypothetical protein
LRPIRVVVIALVLLLGVGAGSSAAPPRAPTPTGPPAGAQVGALPAFAWNGVRAAEQYEFQFAADARFSSPVLGQGKDDFLTKNTRATLKETVPNGTYWWRVRALAKDGTPSAWSKGRSFTKTWASTTTLLTPDDHAVVIYPSQQLRLSWSPVAGATKYLVSLARDPNLASIVTVGGRPVETNATSFTPNLTLPEGDYFWGVTPVDAEGNRGNPSRVFKFTWSWPSETTLHYTDLNGSPEVVDPQLSWDPVPGAARYEVEVNPSVDFAPGSKVCCSGTTIGTSVSPTTLLKNNTYYWRVRAIDPAGNAGCWVGAIPQHCLHPGEPSPSFIKTFDNVPPVDAPSVKNLHMQDNRSNPGTDQQPGAGAPGYQTYVPIVTWDPVPGASSYQVDVTPFDPTPTVTFPQGHCDWNASTLTDQWVDTTAVTAWTPFAKGPVAPKPYPDSMTPSFDSQTLVPGGYYCARVRARSDRSGTSDVYGDYTYLTPNGEQWAFQYLGPDPTASTCTPPTAGYPCATDYLLPAMGQVSPRAPLFTWKTLPGAQSYWVIVAKDPAFTTVVDYGVARVPAYAPRALLGPRTYADEFTSYYWAVLPAGQPNGGGAFGGDPLLASPPNFQKRSTAPTLAPVAYGSFGVPTFRWYPPTGDASAGGRRYRFQVSADDSFGTLLDDVTTDSTAYTSNTTYPPGTVLYWRVRADDENLLGLTWSEKGTFKQTLGAPIPNPNPTGGDAIPTWTWTPVPGALSYDVAVDLPDGTHKELSGFPSTAVAPVLMYGTGVFHWRVRAEFPKAPFGLTPGPWSQTVPFTRTILAPTGAQQDVARDRVLLSWNAKAGARRYRVQIAGDTSFSKPVENVVTDNTSYAPLLSYRGFRSLNTGRLFWRVAALDEGGNVGQYTDARAIVRTRRMEIAVRGTLRPRKKMMLTIMVTDFETTAGVPGARLRASGAGIRLRRGSTSAFGSARWWVRAHRRGAFVIQASKPGYAPVSARVVAR